MFFPSNFLHFPKKSFQKEISFKMEALGEISYMIDDYHDSS